MAQGLEDKLYLGNLNARRDWGHAKDYVFMQWLMLQQDEAEDFVIATGHHMTVRDFVILSAGFLGLTLEFKGSGQNEVGLITKKQGDKAPALKVGDEIIAINPRYYRPTEVDSLLGDPTKAKEKLGWEPKISVEDMCKEMIESDLIAARKESFLLDNGYETRSPQES